MTVKRLGELKVDDGTTREESGATVDRELALLKHMFNLAVDVQPAARDAVIRILFSLCKAPAVIEVWI